MSEEQKAKKEDRFVLTEITTATGIAIQDNIRGEVLDEKQVIAEMLNMLHDIKKAVSG